jgi:hypothetical protein
MTPTNKLRFVERAVPSTGANYPIQIVRILQQWWDFEYNIIDMVVEKKSGEWRDVEVEA